MVPVGETALQGRCLISLLGGGDRGNRDECAQSVVGLTGSVVFLAPQVEVVKTLLSAFAALVGLLMQAVCDVT